MILAASLMLDGSGEGGGSGRYPVVMGMRTESGGVCTGFGGVGAVVGCIN